QFRRVSANVVGCGPADIDLQVAAFAPAQLSQGLSERCDARFRFRIVLSRAHEHADHALSLLLRPRRERPRSSRAAEQRDELAPFHSMTSSARASSVSGTVRPSALAVLRLITSRKVVGCWTGSSPALAPLRIRST